LSLQLRIVQKILCFAPYYDPVEKRAIFISTNDQVTADAHVIVMLVLRQEAWNSVLTCSGHHTEFCAKYHGQSMLLLLCHLRAVGTLRHFNFLDLSTVLILLGLPVCSSSSKRSLLRAKHLCHLNTTLRPKASSPYTCFASGFAYFLAEIYVFPFLKMRHSRFSPLADNYPS
jgi:hypothetical protein